MFKLFCRNCWLPLYQIPHSPPLQTKSFHARDHLSRSLFSCTFSMFILSFSSKKSPHFLHQPVGAKTATELSPGQAPEAVPWVSDWPAFQLQGNASSLPPPIALTITPRSFSASFQLRLADKSFSARQTAQAPLNWALSGLLLSSHPIPSILTIRRSHPQFGSLHSSFL